MSTFISMFADGRMSNYNEAEEAELTLQYLRQLCGYITTDADCMIDHHLAYYRAEAISPDELNSIQTTLEKDLRDYLKEVYPLISSSIYDLDKAYNELSNVLSLIDHQQEQDLRNLIYTAYSEINDVKRQGRYYRIWCSENKELYEQLKNICAKLLVEPRSIIEGVGDMVYI